MIRRDFIKSVSLTAMAMPLAGQKEKKKGLVILHTNDQHSRIDPFPANHPKYPGMGGFAKRAAYIDAIRKEGKEVLLLDAGDVFQGTPYFNFYGGELEFRLMSMMGYDAMTLGNHDLDNGVDGLLKQLPHARFDIINSNYAITHERLRKRIKPWKIYHRGGMKIGVYGIGVELEGLVHPQNCDGLQYMDPEKSALEMENILKNKDCDLIICLSHLGHSYDSRKMSDLRLAKSLKCTDLIVGGHTHTFLDSPVKIVNSSGKNTLISQAGWAGIQLGRIDFEYHVDKDRIEASFGNIKIS